MDKRNQITDPTKPNKRGLATRRVPQQNRSSRCFASFPHTAERWRIKKPRRWTAIILQSFCCCYNSRGGILSLFDIPERHSTKRAREREKKKVHRHRARRNRVPSKSLASIGSSLSLLLFVCVLHWLHTHDTQVKSSEWNRHKFQKKKESWNEIAKAHDFQTFFLKNGMKFCFVIADYSPAYSPWLKKKDSTSIFGCFQFSPKMSTVSFSALVCRFCTEIGSKSAFCSKGAHHIIYRYQ